MSEPERISQSVQAVMKTISVERCDNCFIRPRQNEKKWCSYCVDKYWRKQNLTSSQVDRDTLKLVEPLYANAVLDDLEPDIREKLLHRRPSQDVYLFGLPGRGKTYAMAALIRYYIGEGYKCKRICFDDFCCQVRSTMSIASRQTEWEMTKPYKEVDMLFIDDLGLRTKEESDFAYITFYSILNKRQERLLPTFISSNKSLDRLRNSFDERIVSRLNTALVIELIGKDKRRFEKIIE